MPEFRSQVKSALNTGVISDGNPGLSASSGGDDRGLPRTTTEDSPRYKLLDHYDQYFEGTQYDKLRPWDQDRDAGSGQYIPIRKRKPLVSFNISRLFCERASAKLAGHRALPKFTIPSDPDTEELLKLLMKQSKLQVKAIDMAKEFFKHGTVFAKFMVVNGVFKLDTYNAKWCSPKFNEDTGELVGVRIQYKFEDEEAKKKDKKKIMRWYRLDITEMSEILYDNPEVDNESNEEPVFQVKKQVDHELGFVPGEWITMGEKQNKIDGESILFGMTSINDCVNYQLSQSDQAVSYSQEPQMAFSGMSTDEIDNLIKTSTKAWNLGREGQANFIETSGASVEMAKNHMVNLNQKAQDLAKVVILDPERMTGVYQSGEAMKVLHAPLVDLIEESRPWFGDYGLVPLLQKMVGAAIILNERGAELSITFPEGYQPQSLDIELVWKPVFPPTLDDIQKAVNIASGAATANIVARVTATKFVSEYFGIEDAEAEQKIVETQPPPPSPFGGGFF